MLTRTVNVPALLSIECGSLSRIGDLLKHANLWFERLLVVSGDGPTRALAKRAAEGIVGCWIEFHEISDDNVIRAEELRDRARQRRVSGVVAVGGGRVLDVCKFACGELALPLIAVPTALSHDGISSPIAVLRSGKAKRSLGTRGPLAVMVDLNVVRTAPASALRSGVGDLLSNISAIADWELSERQGIEAVEHVSRVVAKASAEGFLHAVSSDRLQRSTLPALGENLEELGPWLPALADGLVCSGVAMALAGTSRPCSGAEHLISHALDEMFGGVAPHGIQVGVASLFTLVLHGRDPRLIRDTIRRFGGPISPTEIGISREVFLTAVENAPRQRAGRHTILSTTTHEQWETAFDQAFTPGERISG